MPLLSFRAISAFCLTVIMLFIKNVAFAAKSVLPSSQPVVFAGNKMYDLHMIAFYVCLTISAAVFAVLLYTLIKFRRQTKKGSKFSNFHQYMGVEILWTVIPFVILVIMAVPAILLLIKIHNTNLSHRSHNAMDKKSVISKTH